MKKYLLPILMLCITVYAFAQQPAATVKKENGPILSLEKKTHDFGDMTQGDKVEHVFKFKNTGNEALLITNIEVTCGCTTPQWPREPIPAGGSGEITIGFNSAGKMGKQNKVITIISNANNSDEAKITFTTNVLEKKAQ